MELTALLSYLKNTARIHMWTDAAQLPADHTRSLGRMVFFMCFPTSSFLFCSDFIPGSSPLSA